MRRPNILDGCRSIGHTGVRYSFFYPFTASQGPDVLAESLVRIARANPYTSTMECEISVPRLGEHERDLNQTGCTQGSSTEYSEHLAPHDRLTLHIDVWLERS